MRESQLKEMLARFKRGDIEEREVVSALASLQFEDLSFAKIDHHRELRWGFPEVIFCEGKTPAQSAAIAGKIVARGSNLLATRANRETSDAIKAAIPAAVYHETARTVTALVHEPEKIRGKVLIVTAGTSDLPVAGEAEETARMLGLDAATQGDIGVAGIHRLMHYREQIESASVVIVVAGMEGALASVVAGLVQAPVIAVPTSVGYGASFQGLAPLLGMLNSCVPGVAVMNIDNGFGAAFLAFKILRAAAKLAEPAP
ncbi:MAG: nickel pincer cofactor biosynthesis protein LarB [Spirochaetes bacterium]|nr:MAG: nickel pincer cofactor biosynthesis protein LarB [Spirochaetota bacterium]